MKNIILLFTALIYIHFCNAQNVGIGKLSPTEKLQVDSGNIKIGSIPWSGPGLDRFLKFGDADYVRIGETGTDDYMYMYARNFILLPSTGTGYPGNVGINTTSPAQKLDVNGTIRSTSLMLTSGAQSEVLKKGTGDNIVFQKGHNGLGINYIIAIAGIFPSPSGGTGYGDIILGEIRLFAGNFAPSGFMFCQGQLLSIASNTALFSLLGTNYGGDGATTFALTDLRAAVPVGPGTTGTGPSWTLGERSN